MFGCILSKRKEDSKAGKHTFLINSEPVFDDNCFPYRCSSPRRIIDNVDGDNDLVGEVL